MARAQLTDQEKAKLLKRIRQVERELCCQLTLCQEIALLEEHPDPLDENDNLVIQNAEGCFLKPYIPTGTTTISFHDDYDDLNADLPQPGQPVDLIAAVRNSQGTRWIPGPILGTWRPKGYYISDGATWEFFGEFAYQASQPDVDAGLITDQFLAPFTFENAAKWLTKNDDILFENEGVALGGSGTVDELDFVGADVTAARVGNKVTVTVSSAAGATGYTGYTGYTGAGNFTGYTGYSGYTGTTGYTGFTGYTGYTGAGNFTGYTGYTGFTGTTGFTGYTGYTGETGYTGYTGYTGAGNFTGYTGYTGFTGYTGAGNFTGYTGTTGYTGYTGAGNFTGYTGYTGYTGPTGYTGYTGYTGITGYTGYTGYTGATPANALLDGGNTTAATVVAGTNDANSFSIETNNVVRATVTGAASTGGAWTFTQVTANTATVADILTLRTNSTGTAAASFGSAILFQGESSTTDNRDMARISSYWNIATDGTRSANIGFQAGTAGGAIADVMTIKGGGFVGIGTTSPSTGKLEIVAGTLVDLKNALYLTATMPTVITTINNAVDLQITSAGSSSFAQQGLNVSLLPGYTGSSTTRAGRFVTTAAGTGTAYVTSGSCNIAIATGASATTTGTNVGNRANADNGNINIGFVGVANVAKNSATNVGVVGAALNTGTTPIQVGGYFGLINSDPTLVSAALIADNGSTTDPIFLARDNSSTVFTIADGGAVNIVGSLQCDSIVNDTGLAAGVYTPTRSAEANMDANVTMFEAQYMRVGNTVTVSGRFTADPTTTLTPTSFEMDLPIASNFGAVEDCAGVAFCGAIAAQGAQISGSVANNTMVITWVAGDVTAQSWSFTATYQVI